MAPFSILCLLLRSLNVFEDRVHWANVFLVEDTGNVVVNDFYNRGTQAKYTDEVGDCHETVESVG